MRELAPSTSRYPPLQEQKQVCSLKGRLNSCPASYSNGGSNTFIAREFMPQPRLHAHVPDYARVSFPEDAPAESRCQNQSPRSSL